MTVALLPNRTSSQWTTAIDALHAAIPVADHSRLWEHSRMADEFLMVAGMPSRAWANRIAAIAVIAERRADTAPSLARRIAFHDVAAAACALLLIADEVHDVRPDEDATAVFSGMGIYDRSLALI